MTILFLFNLIRFALLPVQVNIENEFDSTVFCSTRFRSARYVIKFGSISYKN